jgi:DNA-binding MurR/RpiR family transcriptional regulator
MFREQIRKHYEYLSRSYRMVADFILNDYRAAAFMTAAGLAEAVNVDTTTVVRFAQRLGYPGYPELIEDIQQQVKSELTQSYLAAPQDNSLQASIQRQVVEDRNSLEKALAHNTLATLETILDLLRAAPRVIVVG